MKNRIFSVLLIVFCFVAVPLTVSADTFTYKPPAKAGMIYVVVRLKGYSSGNVRHRTRVGVRWGSYSNSKSYPSMTTLRPVIGVVIALRHSSNDSVPLTVETDGAIERVAQLDSPPPQWSNGQYQTDRW